MSDKKKLVQGDDYDGWAWKFRGNIKVDVTTFVRKEPATIKNHNEQYVRTKLVEVDGVEKSQTELAGDVDEQRIKDALTKGET